jgi:hypothetical protein
MNQDAEHLRLLSIFHYVVVGVAAFCSFFPLLYTALGFVFAALSHHPPAAEDSSSRFESRSSSSATAKELALFDIKIAILLSSPNLLPWGVWPPWDVVGVPVVANSPVSRQPPRTMVTSLRLSRR